MSVRVRVGGCCCLLLAGDDADCDDDVIQFPFNLTANTCEWKPESKNQTTSAKLNEILFKGCEKENKNRGLKTENEWDIVKVQREVNAEMNSALLMDVN